MFTYLASRSLVLTLLLSAHAVASEVCVAVDGGRTELSLCGGKVFRTTDAEVTDTRLVSVPDSTVLLVLWNEHSAAPGAVPYYAISVDGEEIALVRRTSYELKLKYGRFDPLQETPAVDQRLAVDASNQLYIVQFVTQPLGVFRRAIANLGGFAEGRLASSGKPEYNSRSGRRARLGKRGCRGEVC